MISLLDDNLEVSIYFDRDDSRFQDNIGVCILENCPQCEKLFIANEINCFITPDQAHQLIAALEAALQARRAYHENYQ
ncbi:MAG TPA: hypothetical protein VKF38_17230 [Anaerolineaceae bacterium]|nr:hypothetical protein [Anaerolineaceae bacterium]